MHELQSRYFWFVIISSNSNMYYKQFGDGRRVVFNNIWITIGGISGNNN